MNGPIKVDVVNRLNRNLGLLNAGATVTIDVTTPAGKRGKFRTTFIGYLPKQYVMIQFPESYKLGAFSQYLTQGTNITVRGIIEGHEGAIVAFVSPIRQTLQIPSRIMVLEFPKTVSLQSLRSNIRIDIDIPAKIKVSGQYWQASTMDISINGCQMFVSNADSLLTEQNKNVEIVIEDFQDMGNLKLNATICNVKQQIDGVTIGVQFTEDQKQTITSLLQHAIESE